MASLLIFPALLIGGAAGAAVGVGTGSIAYFTTRPKSFDEYLPEVRQARKKESFQESRSRIMGSFCTKQGWGLHVVGCGAIGAASLGGCVLEMMKNQGQPCSSAWEILSNKEVSYTLASGVALAVTGVALIVFGNKQIEYGNTTVEEQTRGIEGASEDFAQKIRRQVLEQIDNSR